MPKQLFKPLIWVHPYQNDSHLKKKVFCGLVCWGTNEEQARYSEKYDSIFSKNPCTKTDQNMRNTLLCLGLAITIIGHAQTAHPWELGLSAGAAAYHGDLYSFQGSAPAYNAQPSFALYGRKNLHNTFAIRANLLFAKLTAQDVHPRAPAWQQTRGLSFSAPLLEGSVLGEWYPWGLYKTKNRRKKAVLSEKRRALAPFIAFGVGVVYAKPTTQWNDASPNEFLDPLLVQIDKNHAPKPDVSIPLGIGIRGKLSQRWTLGLQAIVAPTLSDYLDGVSVAGNPAKNDWLGTVQASISVSFGKNKSGRKNTVAAERAPLEDRDGDGIPDEYDACPDTAGLRSLLGCPDQDRDGVKDSEDDCPYVVGLYALRGCPDTDGDGIADKDDHCPDLKGVAAFQGCPAVDRDEDGVADAEDLCPDMKGESRWKGCPDTDGDGLPDNKDGCPGIAGPANLRGCPDSDGDGISDKEDECPTLPGSVEKNGCPDALPAAAGVPFKAVYFGSTLQEWYKTSLATLQEVQEILESDAALFARIEGHTDNTGREPANDLLAEKRAKKCLDHLVSRGIDPKRLHYLGYGSQKPAFPNDTRENRQLNRRVEIYFYRK